MKITLLAVSFLAIGLSAAQTTVTFTSNRDLSLGYHDNFPTENTNYNYAHQTSGFVIPGAAGGVNSNRGLIGFDLSSLPAGCQIMSAKLNLYALVGTLNAPLNNGHCGSNESYLRRVTTQWNDATSTWNTQPASTTVNQALLAQSTSNDQDYLNINVTGMVQDMVNDPNQIYSFLLGLIDETLSTKALLFCSTDHGVESKYPTLVVTYKDVLGAPQQEQSLDEILVYPNPSAGIFEVVTDVNSDAAFEVTDMNGAVLPVSVEELNEGRHRINLIDYPAGVYFLNVRSVRGNQIVRLVKAN